MLPSIFSNNFFDDFFDFPTELQRRSQPVRLMQPMHMMRTDIRETDKGYELDVDLPGYKKDELKLSVDKGYLTIEAAKTESKKEDKKDGSYLRRERFYGSMSRTFYVGDDVVESDIKAAFDNGILKLSLPKKSPQELVTRKYISID